MITAKLLILSVIAKFLFGSLHCMEKQDNHGGFVKIIL